MADHVRGPAPRPHREYPQIAAALAAPDPTPAVPPMDAELDALVEQYARLSEYRTDVAVSDAPVSAVEMVDADLESVRLEIWSWVVAYGDRRAEEARAPLVEAAFREGVERGLQHRFDSHLPNEATRDAYWMASAARLAAQSSPAPEGT